MGARSFYTKINSDPAYQAKFIADPLGVLASEGIMVTAQNQKELMAVIDEVRNQYRSLAGAAKNRPAMFFP